MNANGCGLLLPAGALITRQPAAFYKFRRSCVAFSQEYNIGARDARPRREAQLTKVFPCHDD